MTKAEKIAEVLKIYETAIDALANDDNITPDKFVQMVDTLGEFYARSVDYIHFLYLAFEADNKSPF